MLRVIGAVVITLALAVGIALWAGWLSFGVTKKDGRTDVQVNVNTDKFKGDLTSFKERFGSKDSLQVRGKLASVDSNQAVVQTSAGETVVHLTPSTRVRLAAQDGTLADLRPGTEVMVDYVRREERNEATTIQVTTP
jgi:hypothetical protein